MTATPQQLEEIVIAIIATEPTTRAAFDKARRKISAQMRLPQPANRHILQAYHELIKKKRLKPQPQLTKFFQKAGIRSNSGIAVVTSLLKPYACPGKCVYCPTETRMPKSYIASEPAAARSLRLNFNPYLLMQKRLEMLERNGHPTDKIEYITKGGTWNAYPLKYQYWYVYESFKACNDLTRRNPIGTSDEEDWNDKPLQELINATIAEQRYNEKANHRIIGLTLETRPDAISAKTIHHMRLQGATRIELGLQAPDDRILTLIKRGHTVNEFRRAMKLLRQAGFKVDLHFMPDLPGTTPEHDVEMYEDVFSDPGLKPDMIKIYPNTVIETAELYQWFKDGRYKSYGDKQLFWALKEMKKATPRYCRISRLIRDIPSGEIKDGNTVTNLREMLEHNLKKEGHTCVCLRCREIGRHTDLDGDVSDTLFVDEYDTDGGREYFITYEDPQRRVVYGFLRLRIPTERNEQIEKVMPELKGAAFVRELHVYGQLVQIGKRKELATQHRGVGKRLLNAAERIAVKNKLQKVAVISGVGVRGYYRKRGYRLQGTYMIKHINMHY